MLSILTLLDLVVVAVIVQLTLLRFRPKRILLAAVVGAGVIVVAHAHWQFNVSWTALVKFGVNAVIPSVMALAGNYLAAEIKESVIEKRLWRALFVTFAVFGIVGSVFVENQLNKEHQSEMNELRLGIRDDFTVAFIKYNEAHPQHPLTSEQFVELTRNSRQNTSLHAGPSPSEAARQELKQNGYTAHVSFEVSGTGPAYGPVTGVHVVFTNADNESTNEAMTDAFGKGLVDLPVGIGGNSFRVLVARNGYLPTNTVVMYLPGTHRSSFTITPMLSQANASPK